MTQKITRRFLTFLVTLVAFAVVACGNQTPLSARMDSVTPFGENSYLPQPIENFSDCSGQAMIELFVAIKQERDGWLAWPTWHGVGPFSLTTIMTNFTKVDDSYRRAGLEIADSQVYGLSPCTKCPRGSLSSFAVATKEMPSDCPDTQDLSFQSLKVGSSFSGVNQRMYLIPTRNSRLAQQADGTNVYFDDGSLMPLLSLIETLHLDDKNKFVAW